MLGKAVAVVTAVSVETAVTIEYCVWVISGKIVDTVGAVFIATGVQLEQLTKPSEQGIKTRNKITIKDFFIFVPFIGLDLGLEHG